ncbi:MAG: PHB depolymerase family esterase [Magnetococcales bacterium]|nr:PHB depolymerase family esterase [Magnetococcales bacterium]
MHDTGRSGRGFFIGDGVMEWLRNKWRRRAWLMMVAALILATLHLGPGAELQEVVDFSPNPGHLRLYLHLPEKRVPHPALVVALHGCYQSAAVYAQASGWLAESEQLGFLLLLPEQRFWNNPMRCFNWFGAAEANGGGEVASLSAMIDNVVSAHAIDPRQVFITGLSGGGAMAALMLATRPASFAGGGIVAGVPSRCADNAFLGLLCMVTGWERSPQQWGDRVRQAVHPPGQWPRVSIWQGTHDWVINPDNARELVKQWTNLHGIAVDGGQQESVDGHVRSRFRLANGTVVVEEHLLDQGHGQSIDADHECGRRAPFMVSGGSCTSHHLAHFFLQP